MIYGQFRRNCEEKEDFTDLLSFYNATPLTRKDLPDLFEKRSWSLGLWRSRGTWSRRRFQQHVQNLSVFGKSLTSITIEFRARCQVSDLDAWNNLCRVFWGIILQLQKLKVFCCISPFASSQNTHWLGDELEGSAPDGWILDNPWIVHDRPWHPPELGQCRTAKHDDGNTILIFFQKIAEDAPVHDYLSRLWKAYPESVPLKNE